MNKILYFPYINLPNHDWTTRSLLYWDTVGAIVPTIYKNNPTKHEQFMRSLVDAGLVERVYPANYIQRIAAFDDSFIQITQHSRFDLPARQASFAAGNTSRLHIQKFGERILIELQNMRIARKLNREWYHVESHTARLFMMYLATLISRIDNFTPATDDPRNIDLSIQQKGLSKYGQLIRGKFLKDLMPYPIKPDPKALMKFKKRHRKQLKDFRNMLEQVIIEVTQTSDRFQREHLYQLKLEEINGYREEIYAKLTESRIGQIVFGSMFGLANAAYGFATQNNVWGLLGLVNAAYSSFQGYSNKDTLDNNFAYLALIDKQFRK